MTGNSTKAHAQHLKPPNIDEWEIPKPSGRRNVRKSKFVVPPSETSDSESSSEEDITFEDRLIKKHKNERETSSEEDDVPLMELKKRIRNRRQNSEFDSSGDSTDDNIPLSPHN